MINFIEMTTISIEEQINLSRNSFKTLEEFQLYIVENHQKENLSDEHKKILDERLVDSKQNPNDFISLDDLKSTIQRK